MKNRNEGQKKDLCPSTGVSKGKTDTIWKKLQRQIGASRTFIILVPCFLIIWELAIKGFNVPSYLMPAPSAIAVTFFRNIGLISRYTLITGYESFVGFFLAIAVGVPFSLAVAFSKPLRNTLYPATVALQLVPKIALAPLMITWFGFGITSKILIVFLLCFFPILLNGILGFASIGTELSYFMISSGAPPLRAFLKIRLPSALPQVFVGIKWAAINATVGATTGEWIGGDAGLGYLIKFKSGDLRIDFAFAGIVTLSLLGLLLYYLVVFAEKKMIGWHVSQRTADRIMY